MNKRHVLRRSRTGGMALLMLIGSLGFGGNIVHANNSSAADACNRGGYAKLAPSTTPTVAFESVGKCVSYHARGGAAVPVAPDPASVCLNGGYAGLARAASWWVEFATQAECVAFVNGGGAVVDDRDPSLALDISGFFFFNEEGNCAIKLNGTGFQPNTMYFVALYHVGSLSQLSGATTDSAGSFEKTWDGIVSPQFRTGQTIQFQVTELGGFPPLPPVIVSTSVETCTRPA